ncbi:MULTISPECIES: CBS domain-containing protein [Streptomyces]|uniref:CBS domain-containing protein n=1 Tax=Streptomyces TaxID=1883 RepID=UPI000A362FCC|nr:MULTISPECIES: CBS domain-containing protein [Streptomyces]MDX3633420.1 CBS domain-containing protein [Streptomyces europaeiscabiei]MDX3650674.1 CBS domain-containing protein [Streptomyces europaeiscabiei]WRZ53730.1 CBS domain-containing protein [Streptomyces sp. NBC_01314]
MSDVEHRAAADEARHTTPGRPWTPREEPRQDALRRYLGAVATAAATRAAERPVAPEDPKSSTSPERRPPAREPGELCVRDVMRVPAAAVPGDMPFLDVAHTLSREHVSALPVIDAEDHVIGVVSESDLLAKAAVMAEPHRHSPVGRFRQHRLYEKSHGDTAATLMTFPPVTVRPGQPVADAAWTAAHARLKRLPVADQQGRLVGVVSRADLLRALMRDDADIRAEAESVLRRQSPVPATAEVTVENGVVTLTGRLDEALAARLLESLRDIEDVVDVVDRVDAV